MAILERRHIERVIEDVAKHGDNDTLPFDIDTRFIGEMGHDLSEALFNFGQNLEKKSEKDLKSTLYATPMPSEKLLAPAGYSQWHSLKKKAHSLKEKGQSLKNAGPTDRIQFPAPLRLPTRHWMHAIFP